MDKNILLDASSPVASSASKWKWNVIAWTIYFAGVLYYCYAYLLRVYPSVMEGDLLTRFHLTAGSFGILTSFYYFAYAPMQLPVGVCVDKIGPRRSLLIACCVATFGTILFATSSILSIALLGRFMIGFGAAFAYVTALKIATLCLPKKYFATATGAVTGLGMLAAIFTDIYLTHIVQTVGYEHALFFPVTMGAVLFVLIFLIIRNKSTHLKQATHGESHTLTYAQLKDHLIHIAKNSQMWLIGIVGALLYLPASVFLDVWAIPYLENVYHLTPNAAALGVSIMLAGWIFSSFATGTLADLFGSRKIPLMVGTFGATFVAFAIIYMTDISTALLYFLLFFLGIFCGPHPLCFTMSKENNTSAISGTAIAFANFLIMMGGFVFQPIIGKLLDFGWDGTVYNGIRIYSTTDYTTALSILPLGLLLAGLLTLTLKETYKKN